jgi:hypothetical protein
MIIASALRAIIADMQRNIELIRGILLQLEGHDSGMLPHELEVPGFTTEQVRYHVRIMQQGGLLEDVYADHFHSAKSTERQVRVLITWQGHEFLDAARSQPLWHKAGAEIRKAGMNATFELMKQVLMNLAKEQLRLHGLPML